jgi:hypothetical protein
MLEQIPPYPLWKKGDKEKTFGKGDFKSSFFKGGYRGIWKWPFMGLTFELSRCPSFAIYAAFYGADFS